MEKIDIDWCKQHDMIFAHAGLSRDTFYYLEKDGNLIFIYAQSVSGERKIYVRNPYSLNGCELTVPKINTLTTDDLNKLFNLVDLDYPFK